MLSALLLIAASSAACPQLDFEFHGQPDCVTLDYADARITVTNRCQHALLVDESILLRQAGRAALPIILPNSVATVRDLSAFTLGMNGQIHQIIAAFAEQPPCGDVPPAVDSGPVDTGFAQEFTPR